MLDTVASAAERWLIGDRCHFRRANPDEIAELRAKPGAPHVMFGCKCGHSYWHAKNLALGVNGSYTQVRNIFYGGEGPECSCPGSSLVCIVPE